MIFLIEYDRVKGKIISLMSFDNLIQAEDLRLQIELDLNRKKINHEVVILDAINEEALHKTHRRYFETIHQIAQSILDTAA